MTADPGTRAPASIALARFAASLSTEDIPLEVRRRASMLVLDSVGVALGNLDNDAVRAVHVATAPRGTGATSRIWGTSTVTFAASAAMANGIAVHANDFDDTHAEAGLHASATVVPAVLATADTLGRSGRDVVSAVVVGYEVACRLGAAAPHQFTRHKWHATAACGSIAAATAVARLLGLDAPTTAAAIGIATSMSSGILQPLEEGRPVKAFHAGWAAHNGTWAAHLAASGLVGPDHSLDGRQGFFNAFVGSDWDAARLIRDLGREWETMALIPKPYPCCHFLHALVDASLEFCDEHDARQIVSYSARLPREARDVVCEPWSKKLAPDSGYAAKFSLPYVVAAALSAGALTESQFNQDAIRAVTSGPLITVGSYEFDSNPDLAKSYGAELIVETTNGSMWRRRVEHPTGSPARPLTEQQVVEKFMASTGSADLLAEQLMSLDDLANVDLIELGAAPSGKGTL